MCSTRHDQTTNSSRTIDVQMISGWIEQAGKIALQYFLKTAIQKKRDGSVVTEADKAIEAFLAERIHNQYPHHEIIGEEGTRIPGDEYVWIIDPLDGSMSFSLGLPTWCISVGVLLRNQPFFGIVYLPVTGEVYTAERKKHVTWNQRRIHVPDCLSIKDDSVFCVSPRAYRIHTFDFPGHILSFGSGVFHSCLVARGVAVGAFSLSPRIWDLAAVCPILQNAGAKIFGINGTPMNWDKIYKLDQNNQPLFVCNPKIANYIQDMISLK